MQFSETKLAGMMLVTLDVRSDARGAFARLFCQREMASAGIPACVQINHSFTSRLGAVRGLHFQRPPATETKVIKCIRGAVWDVAVDLRAGSPTFLQWAAVELRADVPRMVVIPDGFAHGFQTLTDDAELLYFHSEFYAPQHEDGFSALDPTLGVQWPLPISQQSDRDRQLPPLPAGFDGLAVPLKRTA